MVNFRFPRSESHDPTRFEGELQPDEPLWDDERNGNEIGDIPSQANENAPKTLSIPRKRLHIQVEDAPSK